MRSLLAKTLHRAAMRGARTLEREGQGVEILDPDAQPVRLLLQEPARAGGAQRVRSHLPRPLETTFQFDHERALPADLDDRPRVRMRWSSPDAMARELLYSVHLKAAGTMPFPVPDTPTDLIGMPPLSRLMSAISELTASRGLDVIRFEPSRWILPDSSTSAVFTAVDPMSTPRKYFMG